MSAKPVAEQEGRYGEVFDRGYQRYDGPKRGRRGAITSLIGYSMKRAMGIRKSWSAKILPFLLYVSAAIPVIVIIGIGAVLRGMQGVMGSEIPMFGYSSFFSFTFTVVGLFVAICAPEMICVDRHERTLPLYFSRAINRGDYVLAKLVAMTLLAMTMTAVPGALLWLGQQLTQDKVRQAMVDNLDDLGKVLILGLLISLMYGAIGLMISSFTNRKGVAIAIILIGFMVVTGIAQALSILLEEFEWSRYILAFDLSTLVITLSNHFFDDVTGNPFVERAEFSMAQTIGIMLLFTVVATLILRWRYSARDDA